MIPPLPPYDGLHPLVVHFPIALLLTAPLFFLAAVAKPAWARGLFAVALTLAVLGTAGAFLAASTGEAAANLAKAMPGIETLLHEHEEAGELARNLFLALLVPLGVATCVSWKLGEKFGRRRVVMTVVLLVAMYAFPVLTLIRAAHLGGVLVHERGVKARLTAPGHYSGESEAER